jgi:hypothetical protein
MRVIIVHTRFLESIENLRTDCAATDVQVFEMAGERQPTARLLSELSKHPTVEIACVDVVKKYRKSLEQSLGLAVSLSVSGLGGERALRDWLGPALTPPSPTQPPTKAFRQAMRDQSYLLAAEGALDRADHIATYLYPFAARAARALADYADKGCKVGPIESFFLDAHGVRFAPNGHVSYQFRIVAPAQPPRTHSTEWHLKDGDYKKDPREAPRIYFSKFNYLGRAHVVVLECGPHPPRGVVSVDVKLP